MPNMISLDEASWRLEKSKISGRAFAELLVRSEPLLFGLFPGNELHERVDLSRVTSFRAEPEDVVVADNVRWAGVKLDWRELCAALKRRGRPVSWTFASDITPEMRERARQPSPTRRRLDDLRPTMRLMPAGSAVPRSARRARPGWFEGAVYTSAVPPSGKRENAAAAIRKGLNDKSFTVDALRATPEKELADRCGVSRDTARKARNDALQSLVENSNSTNDK